MFHKMTSRGSGQASLEDDGRSRRTRHSHSLVTVCECGPVIGQPSYVTCRVLRRVEVSGSEALAFL